MMVYNKLMLGVHCFKNKTKSLFSHCTLVLVWFILGNSTLCMIEKFSSVD